MASSSPEIIVLGGGYAGLTAAARLGEANIAASLTLIDAKPQFVERIRLHEVAAGSTPRDLDYRVFMESRGGRFVPGRAVAIDTAARTVVIETLHGDSRNLPYDRLVYALGSTTDRWTVPGVEAHADTLDTLDGAAALFGGLGDAEKILIAGGGLTAIEAACELAERLPGKKITLAAGRSFAPSSEPGGLSREGFDHVLATLDRLGVRVETGARIASLAADAARLDDGRELPFDRCIWAAGFHVPSLAREAGIAVNAAGQILTDETLASISHPEIVAIGDAAEVTAPVAGICRMSCAAGRPMGEKAARTIIGALAGDRTEGFEFAYTFRCISLGRNDGLIQFVDERDRPLPEVWTGTRGARWKEYICRRTLAGVGFNSDLGPPPDTPPQRS